MAGNFVTDSLAFVINDAAAKVGAIVGTVGGTGIFQKNFTKLIAAVEAASPLF